MQTKKLKLHFKDEKNLAKSITVDYPKENLGDNEVSAAMDEIILSNVIQTKNGNLSVKEKAELEIVNKTPYEIA